MRFCYDCSGQQIFSGITAIYGAGGYHDLMFGGHAIPTGDKTKGELSEVDVQSGIGFIFLNGFHGDLFNTVEVIYCRFLRGSCGDS